jgi:septal ring factor EnvC (AmiA/AmiB activator)
MGSLIEELRRREAAARAEADRLRARIEELAEELARAEEQVSRLAITREEVTRVLEEPPAADASWQEGAPGGKPESRFSTSSPGKSRSAVPPPRSCS